MTHNTDPYARERHEIERNTDGMSPANARLVRAWLQDLERNGRKPSTLRGYAIDLARLDFHVNGAPLQDVTADQVRAFLKLVGKGQAPTANPGKTRRKQGGPNATVHAATRIKCFLKDHRETDLPLDFRRALRANCQTGLRANRPVQRDEFDALLAAAGGNLRDQALVAVLWETSWRAGEVASLRMGSIQWLPDGTARVETPDDAHHLKRGKQYAYMAERQCLKLLRAWYDHVEANHPNGNHPDTPLWPSRKAGRDGRKQVRNFAVYQTIQRLKRDAGLTERVTPHSFRHAWVTRALRKGLKPELIQKQTGWLNLRQLKIYAHLDRQDLEREMRRLQGLDDNGQPLETASPVGVDPELLKLLRALKRGMETV